MSESVFCGYITKQEILIRLSQYGIMTEENLKPILNLRDTQFLNLDTVEYYKKLFERCKETKEELSFNSEDSLDLNDTLAEMEAFISQGTEYSLSTPKTNETSSFYPKISSTVQDETEMINKISSNYLSVPQNSECLDYPTYYQGYTSESSSSNNLRNVSNFNYDNTTKTMTNNSKMGDESYKKSFENLCLSDKTQSKTPIKHHFGTEIDINSPEIIFTPQRQKVAKKTPDCLNMIKASDKKYTPNVKENCNPNLAKKIFKTPLPKLKAPNFKNIVSPISRYISETPTVPLLQKVTQKTIPTSEHKFKTHTSSLKTFTTLPEVNYKPSKKQRITYEERASPLPNCINKYISKPLRFEIIKHKGRKNIENEFEEYFESFPIDVEIEDLSQFIDLETTRIGEISVMISSESKFSSELNK